jgi:hypothetical protein
MDMVPYYKLDQEKKVPDPQKKDGEGGRRANWYLYPCRKLKAHLKTCEVRHCPLLNCSILRRKPSMVQAKL